VSFTNQQPDNLLFGHLTPKWLMQELTQFHMLIDDKSKIKDLQVIISHIKYTMKNGRDPREKIKQQLEQENILNFNFVFTKQGQKIIL
jgi:3',5'-cyclic-nucleotide phosphodiesterase